MDENVTGEVEALIPLMDGENPDGTGEAFFLQPGVIFWQGLESEDRIDGNFGAVYRTTFFDNFIGGGSVFYDYDFQYGHSRIGAGVDLQSGLFQGGINYYHPLNEWEEGRTDYEEQALRGVDLHVALEREVMRLSANLSYWRFEGEEDVKEEWKPSYGFDIGIRIAPGVFLEGGWERHDETVSLDQRWNAGLAFRFSVPDFKGASYGEGGLSSNLWKFVEREKRILYEERLAIPRVNLNAMYEDEEDERVGGVAEGNTVTVEADIGKPLDEDVMLHIMIAETSTAVLGTDFTYGHRVYELDAETGEQSAPGGDAVSCPENPAMACEVMIPAGVTRFDIEADILVDTETQEVAESIDFHVEVPEAYTGLLRGSFVEQINLRAHGNTVQFASAASTLNENPDTPEGRVEVSVGVELPSPVSITLNVGATDDAATAMIGRDYSISTRSLTIPANASSASLTLEGINNDVGEGSKTIELTLSGDLPDGWAFGSQTTHTVTLQDDDLSVFVAPATPSEMEEPADGDGASTRMITVGITQQPPSDVSVTLSAMGATRGTATSGDDFTFADATVMFSQTASELTVTRDITIADDSDPEGDETIILTLTDPTGSLDGTGFSLADPYTITIPANDNTVGFASSTSTLGEQDTANIEVSVGSNLPSPITLNIATGGNAEETRDYTISSPSNKRLVIPAGESSGTITLAGVDDDDNPSPAETIELTISVEGSLPPGWTLGTQTMHTVTLQDDDLSIFFTSATRSRVEEPASGGTPVTITVGITQAPTAEIKVMVGVDASSTATVGDGDYTLAGAELTFPMNSATSQTATLMVLQDSAAETDDETIVLTLSEVSGLTTGGNNFSLGGSHTITIPKNGNTVAFASASSTLNEGAGTMTQVTVNVNEAAPADIVLDVEVLPASTAKEGTDYENLPDSLTIGANQSSGTITIRGREDDDGEGDETIMLEISEPSGSPWPDGWELGMQTTHTVTIKDDDLSIFFITDPSETPTTPSEVEEPARTGGNVTTKPVTIAVGITSAPTADIKVRVRTAGEGNHGQTAKEGSNSAEDYTFSPTDIIFPAMMTTPQTTTLTLVNTGEAERDETIVLRLSAPDNSLMMEGSNFTLGADHTITIPANDNVVSFTTNESTLAEEDGTTATVSVNVANPAPNDDIILNIAVTGTATENEDYTIDTKRLTIGANQSSGMITLESMEDSNVEGDETIMLEISEPSGSPWPDGWDLGMQTTHTVTIKDDDLRISFAPTTPSEAEEPASGSGGTPVTIAVDINHAPDADIMVMVEADASSTASASDGDYTLPATPLTFGMGSTTQQTITLMVLQDSEAETEDEDIVLTLTGVGTSLADEGQGFVLGGSHTITIPKNGNTVAFASGTSSFTEGAGTTGVVTVNVNKPAPNDDITVNVEVLTASSTATETGTMADFTIPDSLTITAGQSSGTITLTSIDDSMSEGDETIMLEISEPSGSPWPDGWELGGQTTHIVTLRDDDLRAGFTTEAISFFEPDGSNSDSHTVMVELSETPAENVNLTIGTDDSTAGTADYSLSTTTVSFTAGDTGNALMKPVTITINPDNDSEGEETVVLKLMDQGGSLQNGANDFRITTGTFTLTIPTNDNTVQFTEITGQGDLGEASGTTTRNLRVSIADNLLPTNTNINIKRGGTATEGEDYNITVTSPSTASYAAGVLTIPANEGQVDLTVTVIDDPGDDWATDGVDPEMIELTLEDPNGNLPSGWAINASGSTENLTIIDNDRVIFFDGDLSPTTPEDAGSSVIPTISLSISSPLTEDVPLSLMVEGDSSTFLLQMFRNGNWETFSGGMLTLPSGDANIMFRIFPLEDSDPDNEVATFTIVAPDNLPPTIRINENNVWRVEIMDTAGRTVSFSSDVSEVTEGSTAEVRLEISPPIPSNVTIPITRTSGNSALYSLSASAPSSASVTTSGAVHMVNFIQSENSSSVTLTFTAEEDNGDRMDDKVIFSLLQADMPAGYNASLDKDWEVRITDNDKRMISFADASLSVGEGGAVMTQLEITPAIAGNFSVPVIVTGNETAYSLDVTAPASASYSNDMIHFIQSEDNDSVTLRFEASEDSNNENETITIAIDEDNLPPDYMAGTNDTIAITIMDDDTRAVSFRFADSSPWGSGRVSMFERDIHNNLQLHISPRLGSGQTASIPLRITGDADAYQFTIPQGEDGSLSQNQVTFVQNAESVNFSFQARMDSDQDRDRVRIAIDEDNLPDGFYLGANTSVEFDIYDIR